MHRILLPFLLILSLIACCIEVDISVPSFPGIAAYFGVSDGVVQLTIAYNFLGFCIASLFYGPLSESYGRRNIMIIGNALLLVGAVGCVWAPSISFLLFSRFIQGIGASTSAVVVFAIIADVYQGNKAINLIGIMNSIFTILMAVAPIIGGFIADNVGWRGNYLIVAIICLISWFFLFLMLPETKKTLEKFSVKKTLKDYRILLSSLKFISFSLVPSLLYSGYMSFIASSSFLYIETFGLSVISYTLHQGSIVAPFAMVSIFSGKIIQKLGAKACIIFGIALCFLASLALTVLGLIDLNSPGMTTGFMIVSSVGAAVCYPVIFASSLEIFPAIRGTASSAIMGMRAFLCSASVTLTGYLYNGHLMRIALVILLANVLGSIFAIKVLRS